MALRFACFVAEYSAETVCMNNLMSTQIFVAYYALGRRFPELEPHANPHVGVKGLKANSQKLVRTLKMISSAVGGRLKDRVPAVPLFMQDIRRHIRSQPWSPSGFRYIAMLLVCAELGYRFATFLMCFPNHVVNIGNGRWRFNGLYDVKNDNNYHEENLSLQTSTYVEMFKHTEDMREWVADDNTFHVTGVPHIDELMHKCGIRSGLPNYWNSSTSGRVARANKRVAELILQELRSRAEAEMIVKAEMGWASTSDAIRFYLTPIIDRFVAAAGLCSIFIARRTFCSHMLLLFSQITTQV